MRKQRERGISLVGLIVVLAMLGGIGLLAMQVVPTYIEYRAILGAIERAKKDGGESIKEIQDSFNKSAEVGYITAIQGRDLVIQRDNGQFEISFEYEKKIPLAGPASLLMEYKGTTAKEGAKKKAAE
jgi:type II secretory pathway pseudopilin PulG